MRILSLSRYGRLGASSRLRSYQYLPYLTSRGFEISVAPLLDDVYLRGLYGGSVPRRRVVNAYLARIAAIRRARQSDLVWVEKEFLPFLPAFLESSLTRGLRYVADYDDALFHNYDLHPNRLVRALLGTKIDAVMRHAAMVFAGNEYLADRARNAGAKRVAIVPTVIDLERYSVRKWGHDEPTIGWIGSPVTTKYLTAIEGALWEAARRHAARVIVVGGGRFHFRGVPMQREDWSEDTEVASIQRFSVGIMPLPDDPWERGKCGYKLIQCMACGVPVVASPVGVNASIVEHGVNGFLASTEQEWVEALSTLLADPLLRERMGRAGREKVEREYSLQVMAPRVVRLLREL